MLVITFQLIFETVTTQVYTSFTSLMPFTH